ncbi:MAG: substrate-binding domain-containing protein [Clostridiales bacterium]|jgi:phosphate transport system substrate-binding protein|nr:substrate-binding domain-containing protein [Clostridiales bacterium]
MKNLKIIGKIILALLATFIFSLPSYILIGFSFKIFTLYPIADVFLAVMLLTLIVFVWLILFNKRHAKRIIQWFLIVEIILAIPISIIAIKWNYDANVIPQISENTSRAFLTEYAPNSTSKIVKQQQNPLWNPDDLPKLDGSTALYPLYSAFAYNLIGDADVNEPPADMGENIKAVPIFDEKVACTQTDGAYQNLVAGSAEVIFVPEPSDNQKEYAAKNNLTYEFTPVGKDAFVFLANSKNKVDNLSTEQIKQIYSGEITNWKELGGKNKEIKAYQREEDSGSQTIFNKIMSGTNVMEAPTEDYVGGMWELMNRVSSYKNYDGAIGYSFRFFTTEMVRDNQIKLLSIDGVEPTEVNIINDSYPFSDNFYAVTIKERNNEKTRKFIEFVTSEAGQDIVTKTGYVAVD